MRAILEPAPDGILVELKLQRLTDRTILRRALMAAALAPECVDVVPGGHDWPAWLRLRENFLDTRFPSSHAPT